MKDFIVFGSTSFTDAEINEVVDTLKSGWVGTGPKVKVFEKSFEKYKQSGHAVAVNSCTAALHLSLLQLKLNPNDEVITTSLTFAATVNAIIHAGGKPVLVDVNPASKTIEPDKIREKLNSRTRAILPVHFAGYPCEMNEIMSIACSEGLAVIEDCAHAVESIYDGRPIGTFGDFGCFSFYATKNITTAEGGLVLARDEDDAARVRIASLHGLTGDAWKRFSSSGYQHYSVATPGYKYNMTDIQASLGIHQLARVDEKWLRRKAIWEIYINELSGLPVTLPRWELDSRSRHAYHLFTLEIVPQYIRATRDEVLQSMKQAGIGCGVHYLPVNSYEYYQQRFSWSPDDTPVARDIGLTTLSLPLSPSMTDDEVSRVVEAVRRITQ